MRPTLALGLIAVSLAAVAGASAAPQRSGLHGTVSRGPITPVCREGVACDAPAPNIILTFSRAGRVRMTRTDRQGAYRIELPPGIYAVRTNAKPFGQIPHPATVHVRVGRTDKINLTIDTGIR
jgi:hypothetical protein